MSLLEMAAYKLSGSSVKSTNVTATLFLELISFLMTTQSSKLILYLFLLEFDFLLL